MFSLFVVFRAGAVDNPRNIPNEFAFSVFALSIELTNKRKTKNMCRAGPFRERKWELSLLRCTCSGTNTQKKESSPSIRLRPSVDWIPRASDLATTNKKNLMPWPEGAFSLSSLAFPKTTPNQPYGLTRPTTHMMGGAVVHIAQSTRYILSFHSFPFPLFSCFWILPFEFFL